MNRAILIFWCIIFSFKVHCQTEKMDSKWSLSSDFWMDKNKLNLELDTLLSGQYELADMYYLTGQCDKSIKIFLQILSNLKKDGNNDLKLKSGIYNHLGAAYLCDNDFGNALKYFKLALEIRKALKDTAQIANSYSNIGLVYRKKKKYLKALSYHNTALNLFNKTLGKSGIANELNNIGTAYSFLKEYEKAESYLLKSLKLTKELKSKVGLLDNCHALANNYFKQGKYKRSSYYYKKAENLTDSIFKNKAIRLTVAQKVYQTQKKDYEKKILLLKQKEQTLELKYLKAQNKNQKNIRNASIVIAFFIILSIFLVFNRSILRLRNKQIQLSVNQLETEQKLLRAQMNPHFIFNAINAVQSLILDNDSSLARKYLIKFSRLVRSILDQTSQTFITLKDEIETMKLYLQLEQLRIPEKFTYEFRLPANISVADIKIPPFLIQPFLENALIHGIRNKRDSGHILIQINIDKEILKCKITDNGIGRRKADEINRSKKKTHSSKATELTINRINRMNKKGAGFEITDLYDNQNEPSGTRVELHIPYK